MESTELTVLPPESERQIAIRTEDYNDMFCNESRFAHFYHVAQVLASSPIVPANFKSNPGSCLIALSLARRMNIDPLMLMQKLYIIGGKPSIEAQLGIALVNTCGRFTPLEFVYEGEGQSRSCYAMSTRKADGKVLVGTKVTMAMAKGEGWLTKTGSKWLTMPEQMLGYRCGIFWARLFCPELLLGLPTADELEDIEPDKIPKTHKLPENIGSGMNIYEPAKQKEPDQQPAKPRHESVIDAFAIYQVTEKELCTRAGMGKDSWNDDVYADLTNVIRELKKGCSPSEFFLSPQSEQGQMSDHDKACARLNELSEANKKLVDKHLAGRNPDHMTDDEIDGLCDKIEDEMQ